MRGLTLMLGQSASHGQSHSVPGYHLRGMADAKILKESSLSEVR